MSLPPAFSFLLFLLLSLTSSFNHSLSHDYQQRVLSMFTHSYNGYMNYAFPYDELLPITCSGYNTLGGYSLTLLDTLDSLVIFGMYKEFEYSIEWILKNLNFNIDINISVFETNIRMLGSLLSSHMLLCDEKSPVFNKSYNCNNGLLYLAVDLANRLMPAFNTSTGLPYGTVNLKYGVPINETPIVATAGAGTFIMEFAVLSRLTGDRKYEIAANRAIDALYKYKSKFKLFGQHIDSNTGAWIGGSGGVGNYIDSFYEYLLKGYLLIGKNNYLTMFDDLYDATKTYLMRDGLPILADINNGNQLSPFADSLQAFWPGLQVLYGDIYDPLIDPNYAKTSAIDGVNALIDLSKNMNYFLPEYIDPVNKVPGTRRNYPLRPELAESLYYCYKATGQSHLLEHAMHMVDAIEKNCKTTCGYAALSDVMTLTQDNKMDSYFLAETLKYFYLLFSLPLEDINPNPPADSEMKYTADVNTDNIGIPNTDPTPQTKTITNLTWFFDDNYLFTTEAHIMSVPFLHRTQLYSTIEIQVE